MENYRLLQFKRQFVKVKGLTANKGEITLNSFLTMQPIWKQLNRVLTFFHPTVIYFLLSVTPNINWIIST